jgi:starch synthase
MKKPLKILFVTTDLEPFCKAGGLGDVSRDLPSALRKAGADVRIILPLHGAIDEKKHGISAGEDLRVCQGGEEVTFRVKEGRLGSGLPVYFIDKHKYFGGRSRLYGYEDENLRFSFFCKAVLAALDSWADWTPDVIHCNDWHTGLIPELLKKEYATRDRFLHTKTLFTIHNLTFQFGTDWWTIPKKERDTGKGNLAAWLRPGKLRRLNFAKRGILYADMVNTVSERYAQELMQKDFGQELHNILLEKFRRGNFFGIVNGIDYREYNPETDPGLVCRYHSDDFEHKYKNKLYLQKKYGLRVSKDIPLLGMVTRITEQKGFDLLMPIIDALLKLDLQFIIVGDGDPRYKNFFNRISKKNPQKLVAHMEFQRKHVTQIYAATDMFLMPSRFEPCGLGQMISLRYGSVPLVRETGGLSDTINDYDPRTGTGNGFTFRAYDSLEFFETIVRAIETFKYQDVWRRIVTGGMHESFSWEVPAKKYEALYDTLLRNK